MGVDILQLYDEVRKLIGRSTDLNGLLAVLPEGNDERDRLWLELDDVLTRVPAAVSQLADIPSTRPDELLAKGRLLQLLLAPALDDPATATSEVLRLALSVAQEVSLFL